MKKACQFKSAKRGRPKRSKTRYHGITADAVALKVNPRTLKRVLDGEWHLPGLMGRYQELKASQNEQAGALTTNPK